MSHSATKVGTQSHDSMGRPLSDALARDVDKRAFQYDNTQVTLGAMRKDASTYQMNRRKVWLVTI